MTRPSDAADAWAYFAETMRQHDIHTGGKPCQAFAERDFGRWNSKKGPTSFQYPGGQPFTTVKPGRSIFARAGYLAVSEEPSVAVAAVQLRAAFEAERKGMTKRGSVCIADDRLIGIVVQAEAKLRRRVKTALLHQHPGADEALLDFAL